MVQWGIGNEIEWTYLHYRYVTGFWEDPNDPQNSGAYWGSAPIFSPEELRERYEASEKGEYLLEETAARVSGWVREMDTTRPTTANLVVPHVSMVSGYADAVDIVGYSYRNMEIPWAKKHFPEKQVSIHENPGTWDDWKYVLEYPGVYSMFMWTGIGYIGERDGRWPEKSGWGDMLNIRGFKNQGTLPLGRSGFHADELSGQAVANSTGSYRWRGSNWHWNYKPGEPVLVEVCTNQSTAELFLNGKSLGQRSMSESPDRLLRWIVPFQEGMLTAKAVACGEEIVSEIRTASAPASFTLSSDRTSLAADAYDVAHLVVQLYDSEGIPVKTENARVTFRIEGDAELLGVDTGAPDYNEDFQTDNLVTDQGRCLAIIRSTREAGMIKVTATVEGMQEQSVIITAQ